MVELKDDYIVGHMMQLGNGRLQFMIHDKHTCNNALNAIFTMQKNTCNNTINAIFMMQKNNLLQVRQALPRTANLACSLLQGAATWQLNGTIPEPLPIYSASS